LAYYRKTLTEPPEQTKCRKKYHYDGETEDYRDNLNQMKRKIHQRNAKFLLELDEISGIRPRREALLVDRFMMEVNHVCKEG